MNKRIHILYAFISVLALGTTVPMVAMRRAANLLSGKGLRSGRGGRQLRTTRTTRPTGSTGSTRQSFHRQSFQAKRPSFLQQSFLQQKQSRPFSVSPKRTPGRPIRKKLILRQEKQRKINSTWGKKDPSKDFKLSDMVPFSSSKFDDRSSKVSGNHLLPEFMKTSELDYKDCSDIEHNLFKKIYGNKKTKYQAPIDIRRFSSKGNRELVKPTDTGYDSTPNRENSVDNLNNPNDDLISNYPGSQREFAKESVDLMK